MCPLKEYCYSFIHRYVSCYGIYDYMTCKYWYKGASPKGVKTTENVGIPWCRIVGTMKVTPPVLIFDDPSTRSLRHKFEHGQFLYTFMKVSG